MLVSRRVADARRREVPDEDAEGMTWSSCSLPEQLGCRELEDLP
jgi:hypothetical protein